MAAASRSGPSVSAARVESQSRSDPKLSRPGIARLLTMREGFAAQSGQSPRACWKRSSRPLGELSQAFKAYLDDLAQSMLAERVLAMTCNFVRTGHFRASSETDAAWAAEGACDGRCEASLSCRPLERRALSPTSIAPIEGIVHEGIPSNATKTAPKRVQARRRRLPFARSSAVSTTPSGARENRTQSRPSAAERRATASPRLIAEK